MRKAFVAILLVFVAVATAQDLEPARFLRHPAFSPDGKQIAFSYMGDIWVAPAEGGNAIRLTVHPAHDIRPRFSPDGKWIAFNSNREGNYDIFLIPAKGGRPKRLTYHSADDILGDWSPDGRWIVFSSNRDHRFAQIPRLTIRATSSLTTFTGMGMGCALSRCGWRMLLRLLKRQRSEVPAPFYPPPDWKMSTAMWCSRASTPMVTPYMSL
jgi:hypothetical protein